MEGDPTVEYDEEAKVDYQTYEELADFEAYDLAQVLEKIKENSASDEWKVIFQNLDDIRRLNKFHRQDLTESLGSMIEFITTHVNNLRSNISKNACVLVQELFASEVDVSQCEGNKIEESLYPVIIFKTGYEKKFIQQEAQKALEDICSVQKSEFLLSEMIKNV